MRREKPYDDSVTEQLREVQEALMGLPGIGRFPDERDAGMPREETLQAMDET